MRDNTAAQRSLRYINESDSFIVIYRLQGKCAEKFQGRCGRCPTTYATTVDYERKAKGFSAVAMPASMPFFLSVWRH